MFEKKQDTAELVSKAVEAIAAAKEQGIITHEELTAAISLGPPEPRYYQIVRKARELFRDETDDGVWTREVPGVGYRYLSPEQTLTEEQHSRRRRARRQIDIGRKAAESLPDASLTDHQRKLKHHNLESHARVKRELLTDERREKWFGKRGSDGPVRIVPPRLSTGTASD